MPVFCEGLKMNLPPRLMKMGDIMPYAKVVADIGSDHGLYSVWTIENTMANKVIAVDISEPSLKKTKDIAKSRGMQDAIECRVGDGLFPLGDNEVNGIVIAGLGEQSIIQIIEDNLEKARNADWLLLQPTRGAGNLRSFLSNNGFSIKDEALAKDGDRFYQTILTSKGLAVVSGDDFYNEFGITLLHNCDPLLEDYILNKIDTYKNEIETVSKGNSEDAKLRKQELEELISRYEEVLEWI